MGGFKQHLYTSVICSNYNFSADGFGALTAGICGASLSARSNVDWMRKLAFRYRRIRDVYSANCTNVAGSRTVSCAVVTCEIKLLPNVVA